MTDQQQRAVFEPFQRGDDQHRAPGTGLGLTIASAHVDLLGGKLKVESSPGVGSRFHFTIPLPSTRHDVVVDDFDNVLRLASGKQVRALIADDQRENRQVLRQILEQVGVTVEDVESGEQAVASVAADTPDILFLDMRMPGLDGADTLERIRRLLRDSMPPAVVVSASALAHERQQYMQAGFDGFVPKPVRQGAVYQTLADLLQVEFERAPASSPVAINTQPLPDGIVERLREDARAGRLTHLTKALADLHDAGHTVLAERLNERARAIDMDGLVTELDEAVARYLPDDKEKS